MTFEQAFQDALDDSYAVGYTEKQILEMFGATSLDDLYNQFLPGYEALDKNVDGTLCVANFFGFELKYPWASSIIDNVLSV